jgi:predicted nucleic acid-binding protein
VNWSYLLDTNHLGSAIRQVSVFRDRLHRARRTGARFGTCVPVLCELEIGIQQTADPGTHRRRLRQLLRHVRLWPVELPLARVYGTLYLDARTRGRSLSHVDLVLAAMAQEGDLIILTTDLDFAAFPTLRTENWLT